MINSIIFNIVCGIISGIISGYIVKTDYKKIIKDLEEKYKDYIDKRHIKKLDEAVKNGYILTGDNKTIQIKNFKNFKNSHDLMREIRKHIKPIKNEV